MDSAFVDLFVSFYLDAGLNLIILIEYWPCIIFRYLAGRNRACRREECPQLIFEAA
jgi:hypothetical protein